MRLFLNPDATAHLRGLAEEFAESTNSIRLELNRFEDAGMVKTKSAGNKKLYQANSEHPLFSDIHNLIIKYVGIDRIVHLAVGKLGDLEKVYLVGDYAEGKDSGLIDLLFIGDLHKEYLVRIVEKAETLISKKVRFLTYTRAEWETLNDENKQTKKLLLWENTKQYTDARNPV